MNGITAMGNATTPIVTMEQVMAVVPAAGAETKMRRDIDLIVTAVAEMTGVSYLRIKGGGRDRRTARARQLVMYLAGKGGWSSPAIGRALHRDHSTVLYGIGVIREILEGGKPIDAPDGWEVAQ